VRWQTRLRRLEEQAAWQANAYRRRLPALPESVPALAELAAEAFGTDDPRTDIARLQALPRDDQLDAYQTAMEVGIARDIESGTMAWFCALPCDEQIRVYRSTHLQRESNLLRVAFDTGRCAHAEQRGRGGAKP
jgi:hypothetical protein